MSDESLREFQLNGKQLVFLFMASTIVAVVIFLCGVMVGRGVSTAQAAVVTNSTVETGSDPTAGVVPEATSTPASTPADVVPDAPGDNDDLKYSGELTGTTRAADLQTPQAQSKPVAPRTATVVRTTASSTAPAAASSTAVPKAPAASPASGTVAARVPVAAEPELAPEPTGPGFVVQVAATPKRSEAEAISGRLQKKGYPAFVTTSGSVFRVRVGKYKDRNEANTVSKRLETEERFKPWVTR